MHDIIAKIENVKDNNNSRITDTDKAYCELAQKYFEETVASLDKWEKLFKDSLETDFQGRYSTHTNYYDKIRYTNEARTEHGILDYMFFPGEPLEEIADSRPKLLRQFISSILSHFNALYNLELSVGDIAEPETIQKYTDVVDWVFTQLEGSSLVEHGIQILIKNFRSTANNYNGEITLVKNRIEFSRLYNMFDYCSSGHEFNIREKRFLHFMHGLGYFDTGKMEYIPPSTISHGDKVTYNHNYPFLNSEKLSALKFYKSGKTILSFQSEGQARAFYGSFNLE